MAFDGFSSVLMKSPSISKHLRENFLKWMGKRSRERYSSRNFIDFLWGSEWMNFSRRKSRNLEVKHPKLTEPTELIAIVSYFNSLDTRCTFLRTLTGTWRFNFWARNEYFFHTLCHSFPSHSVSQSCKNFAHTLWSIFRDATLKFWSDSASNCDTKCICQSLNVTMLIY